MDIQAQVTNGEGKIPASADHVALRAIDLFANAVLIVALLGELGAVFTNIGRGSTVDQDALAAALVAGRLAAAYLDVTEPEPLPPDHALWATPNCFITPHAAGGDAAEGERLVDHFLENLARFTSDRPLLDEVT